MKKKELLSNFKNTMKKIFGEKSDSSQNKPEENSVNIEHLNNALYQAVEQGDLDKVKELYKQGADITDCDNSAIQEAAMNGHLDIVKYLHMHGADITDYNNCAICLAAMFGHLDIVQYLHENGADITYLSEQVISYVAEAGHLDVIEYLRNSGADIPDFKNDLDSLINYYEEAAKRDYFEDYLLDASER